MSELHEGNEIQENNELSEDYVEIICPQCKNQVIIGSDNICPECGCEFEEIEKEYRLTKLGIYFNGLCSGAYIVIIILMNYINKPLTKNEDSLFHLDAFRSFDTDIFIAILLFSIAVLILSVTRGLFKSKKGGIIVSSIMLLAAILNSALFFYTQYECMYYFISWLLMILPCAPVFFSFLCLIDNFITPKSKL